MCNHSLAEGMENFIRGSEQKLSALGDNKDLENNCMGCSTQCNLWTVVLI